MKKITFLLFFLLCCSDAFALTLNNVVFNGIQTTATTPDISVWANSGSDKVTKDETRLIDGNDVTNNYWDGSKVTIHGAKNEVIGFNVILEASQQLDNLTVRFDTLSDGSGHTITSPTTPVDADQVWNYTNRNIEVFYERYLQIIGVGRLMYDPSYDERHIPEKLRRTGYDPDTGSASGGWTDRPNHDKYYPDILIPMEVQGTFSISVDENQGIWVDIYIPKTTTAGTYTGDISVLQNGVPVKTIPVQLTVWNFTLSDTSPENFVYVGDSDIDDRFYGTKFPNLRDNAQEFNPDHKTIWENFYKLAHRNRIDLIDEGTELKWYVNYNPTGYYMQYTIPALDGSLFTSTNGYDGPGVNTPNNVYSVATYGHISTACGGTTQSDFESCSDWYVDYFNTNLPNVNNLFMYLADEPTSSNYATIEQEAGWVANNPGSGSALKTFVTKRFDVVSDNMPDVSIPTHPELADTSVVQPYYNDFIANNKPIWAYNGTYPFDGSYAIEDSGVGFRVNMWTQYKLAIGAWYFWDGDQYKNTSYSSVETDVFNKAQTFGRADSQSSTYGWTGNGYGNGDGVLFYPGTETRYTSENYGLLGPFPSTRLKLWRRGIQDEMYLEAAAAINQTAVTNLVNSMIPTVMWELGVTDPLDPTYLLTDVTWSENPDDWDDAKQSLANIILGL